MAKPSLTFNCFHWHHCRCHCCSHYHCHWSMHLGWPELPCKEKKLEVTLPPIRLGCFLSLTLIYVISSVLKSGKGILQQHSNYFKNKGTWSIGFLGLHDKCNNHQITTPWLSVWGTKWRTHRAVNVNKQPASSWWRVRPYLLLFWVDCKVRHYCLGKGFTSRQAKGTCQFHNLNSLGRAVGHFCSVHKIIQQLTSVK